MLTYQAGMACIYPKRKSARQGNLKTDTACYIKLLLLTLFHPTFDVYPRQSAGNCKCQ